MGERSVPFITALGCSSAMSLCATNCISPARIGIRMDEYAHSPDASARSEVENFLW
jgi:hypothetical protein